MREKSPTSISRFFAVRPYGSSRLRHPQAIHVPPPCREDLSSSRDPSSHESSSRHSPIECCDFSCCDFPHRQKLNLCSQGEQGGALDIEKVIRLVLVRKLGLFVFKQKPLIFARFTRAVLFLLLFACLISAFSPLYAARRGNKNQKEVSELRLVTATGNYNPAGTEKNPFLIRNIEDVQNWSALVNAKRTYAIHDPATDKETLRYYHQAHYQLVLDISFPRGYVHAPIGISRRVPFSGKFDGNGRVISGISRFSIPNPHGEINLGFFGVLDRSIVSNLSFADIFLEYGARQSSIGILAGTAINSHIDNMTVRKGRVSGHRYVGSVLGSLFAQEGGRSTLTAVVAERMTVRGEERVGGLVGRVIATTFPEGYAFKKSSPEASPPQPGVAAIFEVLCSCTVAGNQFVGGIIGEQIASNGGNAFVTVGVSVGPITAGGPFAGGLVGRLFAESAGIASITESLSRGSVSGESFLGGLVGGQHSGEASKSFIRKSLATGNVTGLDRVGGVLGENLATNGGNASLTTSAATGIVGGRYQIGGLVGQNHVSPGDTPNAYVGDLQRETTAKVSTSFASGAVSGISNIGGLVGENLSSTKGVALIENTFSLGAVSGRRNVGGFVGVNIASAQGARTILRKSYALGRVIALSNVGGFLGGADISSGGIMEVVASYWDVESSGQQSSAGGEPGVSYDLTYISPLLPGVNIFSTWSLEAWDFGSTNDYPALRHLLPPMTLDWQRRSLPYP